MSSKSEAIPGKHLDRVSLKIPYILLNSFTRPGANQLPSANEVSLSEGLAQKFFLTQRRKDAKKTGATRQRFASLREKSSSHKALFVQSPQTRILRSH
jgi:hypothetical protein